MHVLFKISLVILVAGCLLSATFIKQTTHPYKLVYPAYFGNHYTIPEDNPTTIEGVALGRMLFYETALSANNKISCATCHQQSHAFSDGNNFSTGIDSVQQPRNTMALINLLWINNFFWDGRTKGLEKQVDSPLIKEHEMGQSFAATIEKLKRKKIYTDKFQDAFGDDDITQDRIEKALAQFERTLISCNSKYDQYLQGNYKMTAEELNGMKLFYGESNSMNNSHEALCAHCHGGPKTAGELFMNNGLDSVYKDLGRAAFTKQDYDKGRFRTVTLRNIALTAPYMHDARFAFLTEVVDHYSDHIIYSKQLSPFLRNNSDTLRGQQLNLTTQEKNALIAFLNTLTDSSFINNKNFSNPFANK
jgi:cytochrome c peroxidase